MSIAKTYDPAQVEDKWYEYWENKGYFDSKPDEREAYTIVIPPPNVTGVLHMGHILNNTIQDVLIRRARMQGYNACWVPGTDHASIATEAKVVKLLKEQGIDKRDIGREKFLEHAHSWKEKYGGRILQQLRKLGASCDWKRTRFTMEEKLSDAVIKVFVDLYKKGHIYKGQRMTNWDPVAKTAVSDEEVYHKEVNSKLYHIRYKVEGTDDKWVTIATTRPETILGDSAVCFHPEDERYTQYKDQKVLIPLIDRAIPTIYDSYVEMEFGTGALKVTPAHDHNDYEIGKRHSLETIDILNADGTLSTKAKLYIGEDRFKARKLIAKELEEKGYIVKVEELQNKLGYSERTNAVIEPRLTEQWFVSMEELAKPALENVMNDNIKFYPSNYKNLYKHWMENVRDWCISRQLWWGQQIPAYYLEDGSVYVGETIEEALVQAKEATGNQSLTTNDLRQDEDVVDTWFSSWLWPISVFDGFENKEELEYYYPTNTLVTGWDIIFFWVARMVVAGYEWQNERPFDQVYFTGMVRDKQGRKMSKSLGNSPEPMDLIAKYGADGVRMGMLLCSPAGGDLLYDDKLCEQGRNFSNKIWNALRLVKGWEVGSEKNETNVPAIQWFENKFQKALSELEQSYSQFRISEALMTCYTLIWNDFCSSYLEMIKPNYGDPIDQYTLDKTNAFFEQLIKILHPFMPFITEEIYHELAERKEGDDIMMAKYPEQIAVDERSIAAGELAREIVTKVRDIRNKAQVKPSDTVKLFVNAKQQDVYADFAPIISKLSNLSCFEYVDAEVENTVSFIANQDKFFVETGVVVDVEAEKSRIEKELEYQQGFLNSISKKLSNERFVNNAPTAVVDKERQKMSSAEEKIKILEQSLAQLN